MKLIKPHGGKLINREISGLERQRFIEESAEMPRLQLNAREISDLELIANGAYSPLEGFLEYSNYHSVVRNMRLDNGLPWSIPITLSVSDEQARGLRERTDVALYDGEHQLGVLHLTEKFTYDKKAEAQSVYGTTDEAHPGVRALYPQGDWLLGGRISLLNRPSNPAFVEYRRDPAQTRALFRERGWRRVVAFQTLTPVHRAHEYIQKCALEIADGLLLHPIVGETKADDVPADVRLRSYEVILNHYYPAARTVLSVLPAAMRYAGPREAIFHALIRKNYGCSHFIVGRDHAGVGNYYGTYDAHHIFDEFEPGELGITPLFFDHTFYCRVCAGMASTKTCPHATDHHVTLSGTRVRELLT
ncbi:MAG: sulfate adenylyltransferase, partial [Pyrinomonadaceae bacterium]